MLRSRVMKRFMLVLAIVVGFVMPADFGCGKALSAAAAEVPEPPSQTASDISEAPLEALLAELFRPKWGNEFLARSVYEHIASDLGWTSDEIEANWSFSRAVMSRETGGSFCPNLRGGDRVDANCVVTRPGARSGHYGDSGYWQVNRVHWDGGWLCIEFGYCSPADITATPQTSMEAGLLLLERSGKQPWCFTAKLRRSATCRLPFDTIGA